MYISIALLYPVLCFLLPAGCGAVHPSVSCCPLLSGRQPGLELVPSGRTGHSSVKQHVGGWQWAWSRVSPSAHGAGLGSCLIEGTAVLQRSTFSKPQGLDTCRCFLSSHGIHAFLCAWRQPCLQQGCSCLCSVLPLCPAQCWILVCSNVPPLLPSPTNVQEAQRSPVVHKQDLSHVPNDLTQLISNCSHNNVLGAGTESAVLMLKFFIVIITNPGLLLLLKSPITAANQCSCVTAIYISQV